MTDAGQIIELMGAMGNFGVAGVVFTIWYVDLRQFRAMLEDYRKERDAQRAEMRQIIDAMMERFDCAQDRVLEKTRDWMAEQRSMYDKNICLVEDYRNLASELRALVVSNTEKISQLTEDRNGQRTA